MREINQKKCHIVTWRSGGVYLSPKGSISNAKLTAIPILDLALRSCLREIHVVFGKCGLERSAALTIAETGHWFSTLHTNSAAQTVDRIVDIFQGASR